MASARKGGALVADAEGGGDGARTAWPERRAGVLSQLSYSYMHPVLKLGSKRPLSPEDLPTLEKDETAAALALRFGSPKPGAPFDAFAPAWGKLFVAGWYQLIVTLGQVAQPLLLRALLTAIEIEDPVRRRRNGLLVAAGTAVVQLVVSLSQQRQLHLANAAGRRARAFAVAQIYAAAVVRPPAGAPAARSSDVATLIGVDCQKLFEVTAEVHVLWSAPLQILLVAAILISYYGYLAALAGVAALAAALPATRHLSGVIAILRSKRAPLTDKRVGEVGEVLRGIKVSKLNGWDDLWLQRWSKLRSAEHGLTRREMDVFTVLTVLVVSTPVVANVVMFSTLMLDDPDARLSPADAFAGLALIACLRFPINMLGNLAGRIAQTRNSYHRVRDFVDAANAPGSDAHGAKDHGKRVDESDAWNDDDAAANDDDVVLRVVDGAFTYARWDAALGAIKPTLDGALDGSKSRGLGVGHSRSSFSASSDPGCLLAFEACAGNRLQLQVRKGDLIVLLGPVGSGKSTVLDGILGAAVGVDSKVRLKRPQKVSLATQSPCILNATVRDNVVFGEDAGLFDEVRYAQALQVTGLSEDVALLPGGDSAEIGERGHTLSGGQKARVGLARCVYANSDLALLDDPLSALDATLASFVFDRLFDRESGALNGTAVVLVTHALQYARRADHVVLLDETGRIVYAGEPNETFFLHAQDAGATLSRAQSHSALPTAGDGWKGDGLSRAKSHGDLQTPAEPTTALPRAADPRTAPAAAARGSVEEPDSAGAATVNVASPSKASSVAKAAAPVVTADPRTMVAERRALGMASFGVWKRWLVAAGGMYFILIEIFLLAVERCAYVATEYWLARWAGARRRDAHFFGVEFRRQIDAPHSAPRWAAVYASLGAASVLLCLFRTHWGFRGGVRAAKKLYSDMAARVLSAPMSFFDTTPNGRVLSRFTFDTEQIDIVLTLKAAQFMTSVSWNVTGVIVMLTLSDGLLFLILAPVALYYYRLQRFYRLSSVDLQRLDALSRSPLQHQAAEGIQAGQTLRAFGRSNVFAKRFDAAVDVNTEALLAWTAAQRWIGVRLDGCGLVVSTVAAVLVVTLRDEVGLTPAFAGLLMTWANNVTISLMYLITSFTEAEMALTSVERVTEATPLEDDECRASTPPGSPPPPPGDAWQAPGGARVVFEDVHLRYRPGLPLALRGVSLDIAAGAKVGVVGRSGAGKSSLAVALFRLAPLVSGDIFLDGLRLSQLSVRDLRRCAGLAVVAQDPVLFSGSVRTAVDPFSEHNDRAVRHALEAVRPGWLRLDDRVEDAGAKLSVGERQLLALARAMLAEPRVLLLDEATASVDDVTDSRIQKMLRGAASLKNTTVICVAHRLHTVVDFDAVAVFAAGKCVEYGPPQFLLDQNGAFAKLVDSTGPQTALLLREAAAHATGVL